MDSDNGLDRQSEELEGGEQSLSSGWERVSNSIISLTKKPWKVEVTVGKAIRALRLLSFTDRPIVTSFLASFLSPFCTYLRLFYLTKRSYAFTQFKREHLETFVYDCFSALSIFSYASKQADLAWVTYRRRERRDSPSLTPTPRDKDLVSPMSITKDG
ncbi:hypothetical protein Ddc_05949 [Ditylenchus destructor]|nr:hypothetical protein Ddc_05949 [Ditylenchus destructor]